ncbi:MAG: hypothetical protein KF867_06735 [Cryobacterium sp.]|nr:hypothetical protein [Cryobacterium sp.]
MRTLRSLLFVVPAIVLTACTPVLPVLPPGASTSTPSPSSASTPSVSATPTAEPIVLALPADCFGLVPISVIHEQFWPNFEAIPIGPGGFGPEADAFAARGGITCLWGIPQSDAGGVTVFIAPIDATPAAKVSSWQSAGYTECPPFLDACYYEQVYFEEVGGTYTTGHILVEGFEMRIEGSTESLDAILNVARAAATSMGYV